MRIRPYNQETSPSVRPATVHAGDAGGVGRGMAELGNTLLRIGAHLEETRQQTVLASSTAQATQELQDFAFTLENGSIDQDGTVIAPPDPAEHMKLYEERVKQISERVKGKMGDTSTYGLFEKDFRKAALRESFGVRKNVIAKQRATALGEFETTEDVLADIAARGDNFSRSSAVEQYRMVLDKMVKAGVIGVDKAPDREKKFLTMIERAGVREAVRQDPDVAVVALLEGKQFANLSPDERERWTTIATKESERRRAARNAEDERLRREVERAEKEMNGAVFKEAMDLAVERKLTVQWVQMNRDSIAKADYDQLLKLAANGGSLTLNDDGNREVYSDLRLRAGRGEDVRDEAQRALFRGQIKPAQYSGLLSEVETNSATVSRENWYRSGRDYISRSLAPSQINPGIDREVLARAMDDWQRYSAGEGQQASAVERERVRNSIVESSRIVQSSEVLTSIPTPRFLAGDKTNPNIPATVKATKEALESGDISRFEYDREGRNIDMLDQWFKRQGVKGEKK